MLNDAIYSYLGVPEKERDELLYIPKVLVERLAEELKRKEWQKVLETFGAVSKMGSQKYKVNTSVEESLVR